MKKEKEKLNIPLLPLRGILVFPYMVLHFDVGRDKSVGALEEAMANDQLILLCAQKQAKIDIPTPEDIYDVGTVAKVKQLLKLPGETIRVLVEGLQRAKITRFIDTEPFFMVEVEEFEEEQIKNSETEALMRLVTSQFEQYIKLSKKASPEVLVTINSIEEPGRLADIISSHLNLKIEEKQEILKAVNPDKRLQKIYGFLGRELEVLEIEKRISMRVRRQVEKTQKEYYLREQMKAIQQELGDKDGNVSEAQELREKVAKLDLPDEVEEKVLKEIDRLEKMPPSTAEAVVVRNYLDWVLSLPWTVKTQDRLDIKSAEKILDEDHYGLKKVKERIIEYLAVHQMVEKIKGPILCLVGPPGVGKTSLARSIARALERKFVRVSLGGVRDDAEIRGHRRTYVGALPGRIIQGMKQAGSKNPVFLLDEIDKLNSDFRGDPASALLEVLDPEQNFMFSDHYIELPFDLSSVMFITTANAMHNIPRPLLDRMETIHIAGYTEEEKLRIAQLYLVPKQVKEHGLVGREVKISESALRKVIREYTREAGVRNLERNIAALCRKSATRILRYKVKKVNITANNIVQFLGFPTYRFGTAESHAQVGVSTGLAWTESGGDILSIEVTVMKGKGKLTLTGKLGDVMQESAYAGFSFIRSHVTDFNIQEDFYENTDIHIHVPEGAIPKDGPSAGITMATALVSALSKIPVKNDVAMTGEITLRGRVLPVGGVKEKILAAHRAGIKTVLLPKDNKKDLEEIPKNVRRCLKFIFVDNMDDVLKYTLDREETHES
jgi:ATP-dependent Lon protease